MATFKQTLRNTSYRLVLEVTQQSQSVANNTSTVKYNAYVEKLSGTGYVSGYDHPYNIKINGTTVKSGTFKGYDFNGRTRLELGSGTHTVTHSADGTKSISCSAYFEANQSGAIGTGTASGTLTLSRIPRHSNATLPSSFTLGNAFTVTFNRASSSFYHVVDIKLGSTMVWTDSIKEDSKSITIDRNKVLDLVPNANSTTLSFIYTTRLSDGTVIGSSTRNITCNLNAPSPTIGGITHSDSNSTQFTHFGAYIQSKSKIKLAMTGVSPGRGAKITSYRIDVDGQVLYAASGTTQTISRSGTVPVVAKVTDSRGKTATRTVNLSVLAYKPPAITSLKLHRSDSSGDVDDYGTYAKFSIGYSVTSLNGKNSKSVKVKVGTYDTWKPQTNYSGTHTEILSGFGVNNTYNVQVYVSDYFGSTVSTSIVPTGAVTMMWGRDNLSVGTAKLMGAGTLNVRSQMYQNNGENVLSNKKHSGEIDYLVTTPNDSNGWNQNHFNNMRIENSNNLMVFIVDGITNARKGAIQVGHSSTGYSDFTGELMLNPLGGAVSIGKQRIADWIVEKKATSTYSWERYASGRVTQRVYHTATANANGSTSITVPLPVDMSGHNLISTANIRTGHKNAANLYVHRVTESGGNVSVMVHSDRADSQGIELYVMCDGYPK